MTKQSLWTANQSSLDVCWTGVKRSSVRLT